MTLARSLSIALLALSLVLGSSAWAQDANPTPEHGSTPPSAHKDAKRAQPTAKRAKKAALNKASKSAKNQGAKPLIVNTKELLKPPKKALQKPALRRGSQEKTAQTNTDRAALKKRVDTKHKKLCVSSPKHPKCLQTLPAKKPDLKGTKKAWTAKEKREFFSKTKLTLKRKKPLRIKKARLKTKKNGPLFVPVPELNTQAP